jgi:hypothetical protein
MSPGLGRRALDLSFGRFIPRDLVRLCGEGAALLGRWCGEKSVHCTLPAYGLNTSHRQLAYFSEITSECEVFN